MFNSKESSEKEATSTETFAWLGKKFNNPLSEVSLNDITVSKDLFNSLMTNVSVATIFRLEISLKAPRTRTLSVSSETALR